MSPVPVPCAADGGPAAVDLPGLEPYDVPDDAEVVEPGDDIEAAVERAAEEGGVVVLAEGVHPRATLGSAGPVTIVGATRDGTVVEGFELADAHDLTLRNMTVTGEQGLEESAIVVRSGSSGITMLELDIEPFHAAGVDIVEGSSNVVLRGNRITGEHVVWKLGVARNVRIGDGLPQTDQWVSAIEVRDNELLAAGSDGILVAGANDVLLEGNFIHDVQQNGDHNDGIQVVAVDGLVIEGNAFTTLTESSQDQSIILGHLGAGNAGPDADPNMKVRNAVVANNLIHHWRGAGITLHGTVDVVVVNNTSVDNGRDGETFPGLLLDSRKAPNENLHVINNVFSDIVIHGDERPAVQSNNIIEREGAGPLDLTADPCFVDRLGYHLAPTSPAVNFGTPVEFPTFDRAGKPRRRRRRRPGAPDAPWSSRERSVSARGTRTSRARRVDDGRGPAARPSRRPDARATCG